VPYAVSVGKNTFKKLTLKLHLWLGVPCILGVGLCCLGEGSCWQSDLWLNTEDGKERGVWSTLVMEEGTCWYVGEGF